MMELPRRHATPFLGQPVRTHLAQWARPSDRCARLTARRSRKRLGFLVREISILAFRLLAPPAARPAGRAGPRSPGGLGDPRSESPSKFQMAGQKQFQVYGSNSPNGTPARPLTLDSGKLHVADSWAVLPDSGGWCAASWRAVASSFKSQQALQRSV